MSKHRPHYMVGVDSNQNEIVADLLKLGYDVDKVSSLSGLYDIVVSGDRWVNVEYGVETRNDYTIEVSVRVEIKSEGGELNETEKEYYEKQNHKDSYIIAYNTEDILRWFGQ